MAAKHRRTINHGDAYKWLGTGAITLGLGAAALAGGTGVAEAKTGDSSGTASSSHTPADHPTSPATTRNKSHGLSPTAAATNIASAPTVAPALTLKDKRPKATAAIIPTAASNVPTPSVAANPTAPVATAAVVALKPLTAVTTTARPAAAATTTGTTNPVTNLVTAIQKALLGFQSMFFNTAPKITVGIATKNSDGTYTGQITVSDADRDPLSVYSMNPTSGGTTTLQSTGTNTYEYTYTPSDTALITVGFKHDFSFSVEEDNYASHWHGFPQMTNFIEVSVLSKLYNWALYTPALWGTTFDTHLIETIGPPATPTAATALAATLKPVAATSRAPQSATNPVTAIADAIQKFRHTYFNTAPEITVTTPAKNTDGAYTGQITVSDADGDPLSVYSENPTDGGTTTLRAVDTNTYEFIYTPSESALTTVGYAHSFDFSAQETNYADHWHGFAQMLNYLVFGHAKNEHGYPIYFPFVWGTSSSDDVVAIGPTVDPTTTTTT